MINDFSDVIILETLKISELEPRNVPGIETNWDVDICGCMRSLIEIQDLRHKELKAQYH